MASHRNGNSNELRFKTEAELTARLAEWLKGIGWTPYSEIQCPGKAGCADIVALQDNQTWVFEVKLEMCLDLLDQALDWVDTGHYVSIVVPPIAKYGSYNNRFGAAIKFFCKTAGIGLLQFEKLSRGFRVVQIVTPRLQENVGLCSSIIANQCLKIEPMKPRVTKNTPYGRTIYNIIEYLQEHGSASINEIVRNCDHHYKNNSSATFCLKKSLSSSESNLFNVDFSKKQVIVSLKEA